MANRKSSSAYDLSLFETKKAEVVEFKPNKKKEREMQRKNSFQHAVGVFVTFVTAAVVVAVLCMTITSRVSLTEIEQDVIKREKALQILQSENVRLADDLARKTSGKQVEQYAIEELGMQKRQPYQVKIYKFDKNDVVEAKVVENNVFVSIWNNIKDFFSNLF